jgi:hypothetical protein
VSHHHFRFPISIGSEGNGNGKRHAQRRPSNNLTADPWNNVAALSHQSGRKGLPLAIGRAGRTSAVS